MRFEIFSEWLKHNLVSFLKDIDTDIKFTEVKSHSMII